MPGTGNASKSVPSASVKGVRDVGDGSYTRRRNNGRWRPDADTGGKLEKRITRKGRVAYRRMRPQKSKVIIDEVRDSGIGSSSEPELEHPDDTPKTIGPLMRSKSVKT